MLLHVSACSSPRLHLIVINDASVLFMGLAGSVHLDSMLNGVIRFITSAFRRGQADGAARAEMALEPRVLQSFRRVC